MTSRGGKKAVTSVCLQMMGAEDKVIMSYTYMTKPMPLSTYCQNNINVNININVFGPHFQNSATSEILFWFPLVYCSNAFKMSTLIKYYYPLSYYKYFYSLGTKKHVVV